MVAYQRRRPKPRGQPPKPAHGEGGAKPVPPEHPAEERPKDDLQQGAERHEKLPGREDYGH